MLTRICRSAAVAAALLLALLGAVVLAAVSPAAFVGVLGMAAIIGAIVATQLPGTGVPGEPPTLSRARRRAAGARAAAVTVAVLLGMTGSASVLGAAAAPVLLLFVVGGGAGLWHHRAAWWAFVGAAAPAAVVPHVVPGALTLRALCQAWHSSQRSLPGLPAGPVRAELISSRERLLDELERRDPVGFRRWVHRGVHASSDPGHYLTENRTSTARTPRGDDSPASS